MSLGLVPSEVCKERICSRSCLLDSHHLPVSLDIIFPWCMSLSVHMSSFYKDNSPVGLGATLMTTLTFSHLCKDALFK